MLDTDVEQASNGDDSQHQVAKVGKRKKIKAWHKAAIVAILLICVISIGLYFYVKRNEGPLPHSVVDSISFPIFYPSPVPQSFRLVKNSAKFSSGVLFYSFNSGNNKITVSEEAAPSNPPDISHLPGFTTFQTYAGNAATGTNSGNPIGIISNNTTLIIVTGSKNVTNELVADTLKSMNISQEK